MTKIAGSGSESGWISQRHGSADPDPDPHHNIMDPEHWFLPAFSAAKGVGEGSQHPVENVRAAFLHSSKDMLIAQRLTLPYCRENCN
jgi:hypothetical protein